MRRNRLPEPIQDLVPKGERVMAWAQGPPMVDGEAVYVVVTERAFYAPGFLAGDSVEWSQVVRAAWDLPILDLHVSNDEGSSNLVRISLDQPGLVPDVVRERIGESIIIQRHVALIADKGVRLVARRVHDSTEVRWNVIFDAQLDAADPQLRERALAALGQLRESVGI